MKTRIDNDRTQSIKRRGASELNSQSAGSDPSRHSRSLRLIVPAAFVVLGCAALTIDIPLARWFEAQKLPGFVKKVFDLAEVFGHGAGVAAILLTAWVLAPEQRRRLPRVICCAYGAGLAADGMKLLLSRGRPYKTDLSSITSVWQTFQGWFPLFSGGSAGQSFTSAHTATAVGLALGLAWMFPRGKWLFGAFAVLVALQRMAGPYHFCSDTLWGAAIGCLIAFVCLPDGLLAPQFDRLERRLSAA
jgi:membrane-associated phospholipid phosphatase